MTVFIYVTFSISLSWRVESPVALQVQRDQIGRFLKVICDKFLYKSSVKILWLFEPIWKHLFLGKVNFLEVFESNWATFYFNIWSPCMTTHVRARHLLGKRNSSPLSLSSGPAEHVTWTFSKCTRIRTVCVDVKIDLIQTFLKNWEYCLVSNS